MTVRAIEDDACQLAEIAASVVDAVAASPFDWLTHFHQPVDSGLPHEVVLDASGNALKMGSLVRGMLVEKKSVAETGKNLAEMMMVTEIALEQLASKNWM